MEKMISRYLEKNPEFFVSITILWFIVLLLAFVIKNHEFFRGVLKQNRESKIRRLLFYKDNLGKSEKPLKKIVNHEIQNQIFVDVTGYHLQGDKQEFFLKFYNQVKDEVSLRLFIMLFRNTRVVDGTIYVKRRTNTNIILISEYFLSITLFLAFVFLATVSFYLDMEGIAKKLVFIVLLMFLFFPGFFGLLAVILKHRDLKRLESEYQGKEIHL